MGLKPPRILPDVHGDIRHLEIILQIAVISLIVHGDIRHLEILIWLCSSYY